MCKALGSIPHIAKSKKKNCKEEVALMSFQPSHNGRK
jgi:hypothetical protein